MALPQIQQARIIQAPGVFDYAMREGPNLAQAFTAGLAAGTRMKEAKTAEENRKADKIEREKAKRQSFEMEFGQDIVTNPQTGEVDIPASREAQGKRKQMEQFAGSAGESYAAGISLDGLTPEIMESPAFRAGVARGMAKIQQEEALLGRITKREEEAQKRQEAIEAQRRRGMMIQEGIKQAGGVLKGVFGGGRSASPGAPPIRVVERQDGTSTTTRTFRTEEERKAYEDAKARESGNTADTGPDPDYTKAARDAIRQYDALKSRGVGADIDFDKSGIPKVTPSSFWDTANDEVIDALRRKVNPRGQPAGRAPVPVGSILR